MTGLSNNSGRAAISAPPRVTEPGTATAPGPARASSRRKQGPTAERIAKMITLIEELRLRPMTLADMGDHLKFSPPGTRKYLGELRAAHLVDEDAAPITRERTYTIVDDGPRVKAFIASMSGDGNVPTRRGAPSNLDVAKRDPARHFPLLADDAHYSVRIRRAPVAPDPLALPEGFFKPSRIDDEPLERTPAAQVARSSFPVPNSAAFVVPT